MSEKKICNYVFIRGKNADQQCKSKCINDTDRCRVHQTTGRKHADEQDKLEKDAVFGETIAKKAPKEKGIKSSFWAITINLNQKYEGLDDETKQKFKDFAEYIASENIFDFITDQSSPDNPRANVVSEKYDVAFEVGEQKGFLHTHIAVDITHRGHLKLGANKIRQLGREIFGHSIHLECPVSSKSDVAWENYLNKKAKGIEL